MTIYKFKDLYDRIDEILQTYWNPWNLNENKDMRDEYKKYTPHIFRLKTDKAEKETIANQLFEIETRIAGLTGDIERCRVVADRLHRLK